MDKYVFNLTKTVLVYAKLLGKTFIRNKCKGKVCTISMSGHNMKAPLCQEVLSHLKGMDSRSYPGNTLFLSQDPLLQTGLL